MADTPVGEVILKEVILSFPSLFEPSKPQKNDKGEMVAGKYKCNLLIPKKGQPDFKPGVHDANMKKLKAAGDEAKAAKWGDNPDKWPKLKPEKLCVRDGNLEDYDGFEGRFYVSASNNDQPVLVDRTKDSKGKWEELTKTNGGPKKLYGGAIVNAIVRLWAQDHPEYGKRINAAIESVQFVRNGPAFGNRKPVDPNEKFEEMEDEDEGSIGDEDEDDSGLI